MRKILIPAAVAMALPLAACQPSVDEVMAEYQASAAAETARAEASRAAEAPKIIQAGKDFLAKTAEEPGVVTLPSGLMYKVLSSPNPKAPHPTVNDIVSVNYEGTLVDGTVFDSSYERGQPAQFPLNRVVQAWQIGIPLMHKGDTIMLYVPSELGYGDKATPDDRIPANSVLVFKVELLSIQGK